MRQETIRYQFEGVSNLGSVGEQIQRLIDLTRQQSVVVAQQTAAVKAQYEQQTAAVRAEFSQQTAAVKSAFADQTAVVKAELQQQTASAKAELTQQTADVKAELNKQTATVKDELRQQSREHAAELDKQTSAVRAEFNQQTAAVRSELQQQTNALRAEHQQQTATYQAEMRQQTAAVKAEFNQQTAAVKEELRQQTLSMRQQGDAHAAETKKVGDNTQSIVSQLRDMRTIIGASFSVYEIVEFGQQIIDAKSKIDIFKTGLTQMIGSKREMNEVYDQLIQLAVKTPFEVEKLFETTFMLKGMGVATKELLPTMEALGNMAAVAGQDKLPLIAKAFTDVMNKGKLMKQEINQFAENGIPLYDLLADSMGKSRKEIVAMAEAHTISFDQVKKAIMDASKEGGKYYQMMTLASETLGGQVSNLKDRFFVAKGVIGDFYEDGLSQVITGLKELIVEVAGSGSALERTQKIIASVVVAYTTWRLASSGLLEAETLLRAASVARAATTSALTLAQGTYNLIMITATGYTDMFTAAEVRSAAAARTFWLALVSNPITAIVAVVGVATTAYLAWSAATTEVSQAVTDQQFQLEKERKNMEIDINNTLQLTGNKEKQAIAIQNLINKYPDYFAGMQAEEVKSWQLRSALESINTTYKNRIALAAEAYRTEANEEKFKALIKKQVEIMDIAEERLGKAFMVQIDGDPSKLLKALESSGENMQRFLGTQTEQWGYFLRGNMTGVKAGLEEVVAGQKKYETEVTAGAERVSRIKQKAIDDDMVAERRRHVAVEAQLKAANDGTAKDVAEFEQKMAAETKLYHANLLKINNQYHEETEQGEVTHAGKVKTIRAASAASIKEQELRSHQDNLFDRIKYFKALEDLEIEQANKAVVSTKATEADKAAAREASLKKIADIHANTEKKIRDLWAETADVLLKDVDDWVSAEQEANLAVEVANTKTNKQIKAEAKETAQERKKSAKEIAQEVAGYETQIQQTHQETTAFQAKQSRIQVGLWIDMLSQMGGAAGEIGKQVKAIWGNWDIISGKSMESAQSRYKAAEADHVKYLNMFLEGDKAAEASAANAKVTMEQANQEIQVTKAATQTAVLGLVSIGIQAITQLIGKIVEIRRAGLQQIVESMAEAQRVVKEFYDSTIEMGKTAMDNELDIVTGSYADRLAVIERYYERERALTINRDRLNDTLAYSKELAEALAKMADGKLMAGIEREKQLADAMISIQANREKRMYEMQINQAQIDLDLAARVRDEKLKYIDEELDAFTAAKDAEIDAAKESADTQIETVKDAADVQKQVLNDQLDALKTSYDQQTQTVKDNYDTQLAALKAKEDAERAELQATYDKKAELLAQSTSDEVEKIGIIDRARLEALERYRVDEVARLQATRDRILATLTDEGERERVTNEYAQRIADVHKQVEDAKLDKTKGVSLATTQLRAEEKDAAVRLKEEEQAARDAMDARYQQMFTAMATERDALLQTFKEQYIARETDLKEKIKALEQETKDKVEAIQKDLKDTITKLQDQITAQEAKAAADKKATNETYAAAVIAANRSIFEANKQMAILELRAQIAILESKKSWTGIGNGKINDAQNDIRAAIGQIEGQFYSEADKAKSQNDNLGIAAGLQEAKIAFGQTPSALRVSDASEIQSAFDEKGNVIQLSFNRSGKRFTVYDAYGTPFEVAYADGFAPATGKRYATGTEYVDDAARPDGVDTVPAWLTKGERVLSVAQNAMLRGIDNAELVRRSVLFEQIGMLGSPMFGGQLPVSTSSGGEFDLYGLNQSLNSLRDALAAQPKVSISMDRNGYRAHIVGDQSVTEYYTNLFNR